MPRTGDHPRIRGEHNPHLDTAKGSGGSSPHTRGARGFGVEIPAASRIIPAYAGSTAAAPPAPTTSRDHPRIRGEHPRVEAARQRENGSSPHTRGARRRTGPGRLARRIIPAYAGSTNGLVVFSLDPQDHPRIRGEHYLPKEADIFEGGSSPHTRGALPRGGDPDLRRRIIPAYAGSTFNVSSTFPSLADHPRIRGEHDEDAVVVDEARGSSPHTRGARA